MLDFHALRRGSQADISGSVLLIQIDRKNNYYFLPVGMLQPQGAYHTDTIIDGELVYENGKDLFMLFFDALVIGGKNICKKPYTGRLGYLRRDIVIPYQERCRKDKSFGARYPFKMALKRLELSYNIGTVFKHIESYRHKTDGLMFTSANAPYDLGTCQKMLKWKPANENTVDFKLIYKDDVPHISILVSDEKYDDLGEFSVEKELVVE